MEYESRVYSNPSWFCFVSWCGLEPSSCEVGLTLKFRREKLDWFHLILLCIISLEMPVRWIIIIMIIRFSYSSEKGDDSCVR